MRSKKFSFGFTKNISEFMIFRRDIGKVRSLYKLCGVSLDVWGVKTDWNLLESGSFDAHINTIVLIKVDIEILDTDIETMMSNDCREVSGDARDTNGVLAIMQEGAKFSCKDEWKFINSFTQLINRLCQVSQSYPRTKE